VVIKEGIVDEKATAKRRIELADFKSDQPAYLRHFHKSMGIDPKEHKPEP
ncbi:MAG: hypothetical protein HOE30_01545, partial [Deltaproteobacteria bacterium]|nr:hypothetical protein [Deltaproteobacteria bacterium]